MRIEKGCAGYIRSQQKVRTVRTVILFLIVFAVFAVGMILNHGDRRNIYSIVAAVGCIPAAMSAVSMIMMWMRKPVTASFAEEMRKAAGDACLLMELYITTSEHGVFLPAAVIRDDCAAAYASGVRSEAALSAVITHLQSALSQACGPVDLTITEDHERFMAIVEELAGRRTEDPELQDEIAQVLLSLSL